MRLPDVPRTFELIANLPAFRERQPGLRKRGPGSISRHALERIAIIGLYRSPDMQRKAIHQGGIVTHAHSGRPALRGKARTFDCLGEGLKIAIVLCAAGHLACMLLLEIPPNDSRNAMG